MAMKRAFISFDFDHDEELRNALVGQAKMPNSPFSIANWSVKEHLSGDWRGKVRDRIRKTDLTIVICGEHTHTAKGVSDELVITREEKKPYFLLWGRPQGNCTKPIMALGSDKIYSWTWDNLKELIEGKRSLESANELLNTRTALLLAGGIGIGLWLWSRKVREQWIQDR